MLPVIKLHITNCGCFAMPQLIQLVAFLTGQLHSSSQSLTLINLKEKGIVVSSWIGKAYEVSAKLQLMSIEDTKLKAAVSLIDDHIKKAEMRLSITKRNEWLLVGLCFLLVIVVACAALWDTTWRHY